MEDDIINALYNEILGLGNILHGLVELTDTRTNITDAISNTRLDIFG
ncbi:hypothetical protein GPL02_04545 [Clostridium sp. MCC334]|nr:hypothetical protein [Clostridium sp. MCC334]